MLLNGKAPCRQKLIDLAILSMYEVKIRQSVVFYKINESLCEKRTKTKLRNFKNIKYFASIGNKHYAVLFFESLPVGQCIGHTGFSIFKYSLTESSLLIFTVPVFKETLI